MLFVLRSALPIIALMIAVSACAPMQPPTESVYRANETRVSQSVDRCRVLDTRQVALAGRDTRNQSARRFSATDVGATIGGIVGTALGSQATDEFSAGAAAIGGTLGAVAGASAASHIDRAQTSRAGVEYSVLMVGNGGAQERIIVQDLAPGDRIVQPGQSCRIATSPNGLRVLPASGLPQRVARPAQTRFE